MEHRNFVSRSSIDAMYAYASSVIETTEPCSEMSQHSGHFRDISLENVGSFNDAARQRGFSDESSMISDDSSMLSGQSLSFKKLTYSSDNRSVS